jgi:ABC-type transporter MlaC component
MKTPTRRKVRTLGRHVAVAAVVVVFLLVAYASAGAGPPTETLRGFFAETNKLLVVSSSEGQPDERLVAASRLVSGLFEFEDAAQVALGRHWDARTPAEQQQFVRLFNEALMRSYTRRLAAITSARADISVDYLSESVDRDAAIVRTRLLSGGRIRMPIDYQMVQRGQRWRVRDVLMGDVSLVANYRAQIHRVIRASSYAELVTRMSASFAGPPVGSAASEVYPLASGRGPTPTGLLAAPFDGRARAAFSAYRVSAEEFQTH